MGRHSKSRQPAGRPRQNTDGSLHGPRTTQIGCARRCHGRRGGVGTRKSSPVGLGVPVPLPDRGLGMCCGCHVRRAAAEWPGSLAIESWNARAAGRGVRRPRREEQEKNTRHRRGLTSAHAAPRSHGGVTVSRATRPARSRRQSAVHRHANTNRCPPSSVPKQVFYKRPTSHRHASCVRLLLVQSTDDAVDDREKGRGVRAVGCNYASCLDGFCISGEFRGRKRIFLTGMSRLISCWEECFSSPSEQRIPHFLRCQILWVCFLHQSAEPVVRPRQAEASPPCFHRSFCSPLSFFTLVRPREHHGVFLHKQCSCHNMPGIMVFVAMGPDSDPFLCYSVSDVLVLKTQDHLLGCF